MTASKEAASAAAVSEKWQSESIAEVQKFAQEQEESSYSKNSSLNVQAGEAALSAKLDAAGAAVHGASSAVAEAVTEAKACDVEDDREIFASCTGVEANCEQATIGGTNPISETSVVAEGSGSLKDEVSEQMSTNLSTSMTVRQQQQQEQQHERQTNMTGDLTESAEAKHVEVSYARDLPENDRLRLGLTLREQSDGGGCTEDRFMLIEQTVNSSMDGAEAAIVDELTGEVIRFKGANVAATTTEDDRVFTDYAGNRESYGAASQLGYRVANVPVDKTEISQGETAAVAATVTAKHSDVDGISCEVSRDVTSSVEGASEDIHLESAELQSQQVEKTASNSSKTTFQQRMSVFAASSNIEKGLGSSPDTRLPPSPSNRRKVGTAAVRHSSFGPSNGTDTYSRKKFGTQNNRNDSPSVRLASPAVSQPTEDLRPSDVPTAANSRAFFLQKETQQAQQAQQAQQVASFVNCSAAGISAVSNSGAGVLPMMASPAGTSREMVEGTPLNGASTPTLRFSETLLTNVIRQITRTPGVVDVNTLPRDTNRWVADVVLAKYSIFNAVRTKLESCLRLLKSPGKVDWKTTRKATAETQPLALVDALVDAIGMLHITHGLWHIDGGQAGRLTGLLDEVSVLIVELQSRLLFQLKVRARNAAAAAAVSGRVCPAGCGGVGSNDWDAPALNAGVELSDVSQRQLTDAIGRLAGTLSEALRANLQSSSSRLAQLAIQDPLIACLTGNLSYYSGVGPSAATPRRVGLRRPSSSAALAVQLPTAVKDDIGPFVHTVETLLNSDLARRLFQSSELRAALEALRGVRAAFEELMQQRVFEWVSSNAQRRSLPHFQHELPNEPLLSEARTSLGGTSGKKGPFATTSTSGAGSGTAVAGGASGGTPTSQRPPTPCLGTVTATAAVLTPTGFGPEGDKCTAACRRVQQLLGQKLNALSNAYRALYRFVASMLGGIYEDPDVQAELTDASLLGSYTTMAGFYFYHDLAALTEWLGPILPAVRRKIKQQTAAVNSTGAAATSTPPDQTVLPASVTLRQTGTGSTALVGPAVTAVTEECVVTAQVSGGVGDVVTTVSTAATSRNAAAAALLQLLSSPSDIVLSRQAESEAVLQLFCPHLQKKNLRAPADRINNVLAYLAWEGGLMSVYEEQLARQQTTGAVPSSSTADSALVDAVAGAVVEGCRLLKEKLATATGLFQLPLDGASWSGRGDDILSIAARIVEAVTLRYNGEIDLRSGSSNRDAAFSAAKPTDARWRRPLLTVYARAVVPDNKPARLAGRISEALPKLLGEYAHQALFYGCPLQTLREEVHLQGVATATAASARLSGLAEDLDRRLIGATALAEAGVANSHANRAGVVAVAGDLVELSAQLKALTDGVVDRHSNQIKVHTNRLEEHTNDLRRVNALLSSHQSRIENSNAELKRVAETVSEMRAEAETAREQMQQYVHTEMNRIRDEMETQVRSELRASLELQNNTLRRFEQTVSRLTVAVDEVRQHQVRLETAVKAADQRVTHTLEESRQRCAQLSTKVLDVERAAEEVVRSSEERTTTTLTQSQVQQERMIQEHVQALHEHIQEMSSQIQENVLVRAKHELSAHFNETISNHVATHMEKVMVQKQPQKRRLLLWATSSSPSKAKETRMVSTAVTQQQQQASVSASRLVQSTVRSRRSAGAAAVGSAATVAGGSPLEKDDLTSVADSASVMEEGGEAVYLDQSASWFGGDLQGANHQALFDGSYSANENGRSGASFVGPGTPGTALQRRMASTQGASVVGSKSSQYTVKETENNKENILN